MWTRHCIRNIYNYNNNNNAFGSYINLALKYWPDLYYYNPIYISQPLLLLYFYQCILNDQINEFLTSTYRIDFMNFSIKIQQPVVFRDVRLTITRKVKCRTFQSDNVRECTRHVLRKGHYNGMYMGDKLQLYITEYLYWSKIHGCRLYCIYRTVINCNYKVNQILKQLLEHFNNLEFRILMSY